MRIKKGYIYLTIISFLIYQYISYKDDKEKEFYSKVVDKYLADVRHQDYFKIHSKMEDNLTKNISIHEIKEFCQSLEIDRDSHFKIAELEEEDDNIVNLLGAIYNDNIKVYDMNISFIKFEEDENSTVKILSNEIGRRKLKYEDKFSFPIVLSSIDRNSTK